MPKAFWECSELAQSAHNRSSSVSPPQVAHAAGRWVGICGEPVGDSEAIPLLLGMGVDEFSMAPELIPQAKATLRTWDIPSVRRLAE